MEENEMNKKLPISKIPVVYAPELDIPLQVIFNDYNNFAYVVAENFINTICYNDNTSRNINFFSNNKFEDIGCFLHNSISIEVLSYINNDISRFIIECLENNYYVTFLCDTYYISNYTTFQNRHLDHQLFIYGYDIKEQCFLCNDYFDFKFRTEQRVLFADIENSYNKYSIVQDEGYHFGYQYPTFEIFKLNYHAIRPYNIELIKQRLTNFLEGKNLANYSGCIFGIKFFEQLLERMDMSIRIPLKHFQFIYAHIKIMGLRMNIIDGNISDDMQNKLGELLYEAEQLKYIVIKEYVKSTSFIKSDILKDLLMDIKKKYEDYIYELLKVLEINC